MDNKKDILEILKQLRPENDFEQSDDYMTEHLLDSMDVIQLVSLLEERFNIQFDIMDLVPENFANLDRINDLINKTKK